MLKRIITAAFIVLFINAFICPASFARNLMLENGTRVRLKLADKVSSILNNEGDEVDFVVSEDVKLGDIVLIKEGAKATGIISELIPRGRVGKAGKLTIDMDSVKAVNGKRVPLNGVIHKKGEEKMVLSVVLSICIIPFFLLLRGTDATLPVNYQYNARVDRDTILSIDEEFIPVNTTK